mmetsp:Transcript_37473/g.38160  ORF Transcript_37473/g.38160 Transcript_37473/m.38160 type:complete len:192 (-) Transcript_37473:230-805(-)|eukprot:CAMPEP_0182427198 /NCGR_PEP_ID=MMETSP1167-20130531/15660_1 /TAXON_ID=2988 /ORGANISM="Mallomonas Sp, Strain CCMP3275" /LENGTH=191 /DNA_ID=CAMNT_0024609251 /DNA_START=45 /DNA_END=620 /DNA_ORIENTATION=+
MSGEREPLTGKEEPKTLYFLNKSPSHHEKESKSAEMTSRTTASGRQETVATLPEQGSWFSNLFKSKYTRAQDNLSKPRKVPIKVEPKVFFANERTFLAWLHMSITLASISLAIIAFADSNEWSQLYGLCLLPVAIAFCVYSLYVFMKRAAMIRKKIPGPFEEKTGPVVLASMLGLAICINFIVKMYEIRAR